MNPKASEPVEKKRKKVNKKPNFAPKDMIVEMIHAKELTDKIWKRFLDTNPNNNDLCIVICRSTCARNKAWEELLKRGPTKEDLLYLFRNLRKKNFLNYYVWEVLKKREDLKREDFEEVYENPKIDSITKKEAKVMMRRYPASIEESSDNKGNGLSQKGNEFVVNRRKKGPHWGAPQGRDSYSSMCG